MKTSYVLIFVIITIFCFTYPYFRRVVKDVPTTAFTVAAASELPKKTLRMATELSSKVDVARISEISTGAATFYAWCKGVLDEINKEVEL